MENVIGYQRAIDEMSKMKLRSTLEGADCTKLCGVD